MLHLCVCVLCKQNYVQWEFLLELKLKIEVNLKLQKQCYERLLTAIVIVTAMLMFYFVNVNFIFGAIHLVFLSLEFTHISFTYLLF